MLYTFSFIQIYTWVSSHIKNHLKNTGTSGYLPLMYKSSNLKILKEVIKLSEGYKETKKETGVAAFKINRD